MLALRVLLDGCGWFSRGVVSLNSVVLAGSLFTNRRLATYAAELGDMDITIAHRSGRIHYTPDWLSRCMFEEDEQVLRDLYSNLLGRVAEVATQVGATKQRLLFDPKVQAARLHNAIEQAMIEEFTKDGDSISGVRQLVAAVEDGSREVTGDKSAG